MAGIDRIIEKIIVQAKTRAENEKTYVLSEIKKEKDEQEKRFERGLEIEIQHATLTGEEEYKRVIANTMLECRKNILSTKVKVINDVFDKVLDYLVNLPKDKYVDFLFVLSKKFFTKGENNIILNENDKNEIGKQLIEKIQSELKDVKVVISEESNKSLGGLIVKNGSVQTNLTFEAILRIEREKLESEVVRLLF